MRERMEKIRVESDPVYQAEKAKRMENMNYYSYSKNTMQIHFKVLLVFL